MKKRFYSVSNMLYSSLIAMLGLGACKSHRTVEMEPKPVAYGPQPVIIAPDTVYKVRDEMKVVYGPPVDRHVFSDWHNALPDADGVYNVAEVMPLFPGGEQSMERWLSENKRFPNEARRDGAHGSVMVSFIVRASGTIDGVAVTRSLHRAIDAEAIRLVKSMPKWLPGKMNGEAVDVYYFMPIEF